VTRGSRKTKASNMEQMLQVVETMVRRMRRVRHLRSEEAARGLCLVPAPLSPSSSSA